MFGSCDRLEPARGRANAPDMRTQRRLPRPQCCPVHNIEKLTGREMKMKKQGGKPGGVGARMLAAGPITAGSLHRKRDQEETRP